jgi:hypothetical protein
VKWLRWIVPGVLLSIAGIVVLELVFRRWPELRRLIVFLPPIVALGLGVLLYGNWIRRDRTAFLSVFVPAFTLAVVSTLVPRPWNLVPFLASIGLLIGVAWSTPARAWWTVHVLRRPRLTPERIFRGKLYADFAEWTGALGGEGPLTPRARRRAESAIARMRSHLAPDTTLGAVRDDLAALAERWVATPRVESEAQAYADMQHELERILGRLGATASS